MSTLIEPSIKNGKFLYIFAWIIEICAASAGLIFAYLTLFGKINGPQDSGNQINLILAAIPFVIVGIVELTKIPLVAACYFATSRVVKYLFGLSLLLVSIITFETFVNGFQQGLQIRLTNLKKIQNEIKATNVEIEALEEEKNNLSGLTLQEIDREYSDHIRSLDIREREGINSIQKERKYDEGRLGGPQQKAIEQELNNLRKEYKDITQQYRSRIKEINQGFEQNISALKADTTTKKRDLSDRLKTIVAEIKNKTSEINKKETQINKIREDDFFDNKELKEVRSRFATQRSDIEKAINKKEAQINKIREESFFDNTELKEIRSRFTAQRSNIEKTIESKKTIFRDREKELNDDLEKIKKELVGKSEFFNPGLVGKREKKESDLEEIRKKRMSLDIQSQLKELDNQEKNEIETTKEKIKKEKSERIQDLKNQIATLSKDLVNLKSERDGLSKQRAKTTIGEERQIILNEKAKARQRLNSELSEEQKKKNDEITKKQELLSKVIFENQRDLEPRLQLHRRAIENVKKEIRIEKKEVTKRKEKAIRDFNRRGERMVEIRNELATQNKNNSDYEAELFREGEKTQIGQWTNHFFNDMDPKHLRMVANVWFGSLAAITALLGTVLAFASMVLRYGHLKEDRPSRITRAVQRYFSVARKNKRKPKIVEIEKEVEKIVEVVKEVPVEKVVTQEVPKEIIRKEIVHVPIASDDLSILDFNIEKSKKSGNTGKKITDKNKPNN